jgi:hypothetical protein
MSGGVTQMVKSLLNNREALSSSPSTAPPHKNLLKIELKDWFKQILSAFAVSWIHFQLRRYVPKTSF